MDKDEALKLALEAWQTSVYGSEIHHKAMLLAMTNMAQAFAAPVQEPVAWMKEGWGPDCGPYIEFYRDDEMGWRDRKEWTPLYTSPPPCQTCEALARTVMLDQRSHDAQRKPLPCETLIELWCDASLANSGSGWFVVSGAFARAIEAAHGIKENT